MRERRSRLKISKGVARLTIAGIVAAAVTAVTSSAVSANGWAVVNSPDQGGFSSALSAVSCSTSNTCVAVGYYINGSGFDQTLAESWNGSTWAIVASPNPSSSSSLSGVVCTSSTNCTAVGQYYDHLSAALTLIESWNGTSWSVISSPNLSTTDNSLTGVACTSSTNCTAVGQYLNASSVFQTLVESWNGTVWSITTSPNQGILDNFLAGVSCTGATSCVAVGQYQVFINGVTGNQPLVESWNGTSWSVTSSPKLSTTTNLLAGVSCTSSSSCEAVGYYYNASTVTQTLVETWNGTVWSIVASPNFGTGSNFLFGVACISSTSCRAVGRYSNGSNVAHTLVETWNGTAWSITASPNLSTGSNYFTGVACTSATSCRAVGAYYNGSSVVEQTLVETWNGTSWSIIASPNPGGSDNSLSAVSCTSSTSCMAVGSYTNAGMERTLVESWNGSGWAIVASPNSGSSNNGLGGVSCTTSTSCVGVGSYNNAGVGQTLIESWNGSTWAITPSPNQSTTDNNALNRVACTSSTSCVAVGFYFDGSSNTNQTLVESWNGTVWSITPSPNQPSSNNDLTAVSCTSATACTAVGVSVDGSSIAQTLIERWNGTVWSISSSPNPGVISNELNGVKCTSSTSCMAVGDYFNASNVDQTLIERWNGSTWAVVASPNRGTMQNTLMSIACPSTTSCVAVGFSLTTSNVPQTLVETWNGSTWAIVASPNPSSSSNILSGVVCTSSTSCTAVGAYTSAGASQTLVETGSAPVSTSITVTSPTTGASWARGSTHSITWSSTGSPGANVKIQLLKAGVLVSTITTSVPTSTHTFTWKVPTTLSLATTYQIKIVSTTNAAVFGISGKFSIT
jgi:Ser-Thr-rich glycosyl-phosphatidyl-inositol-anchored membrane family